MKPNYVFFVYNKLNVGGIETFIYNAVNILRKENCNVGIVRNFRYKIAETYSGVLDADDILAFNIRNFDKKLTKWAKKNNDAVISIYTFKCIDMAKAQKIRNSIPDNRVNVFYCVPHFSGSAFFPDMGFMGAKSDEINNKTKDIFDKLYQYNQLRCFSGRHIDTIEERYGLRIEDRSEIFVPWVYPQKAFNEEHFSQIYESEKFNIFSVSRFEFPHKGFLLGLIKDYGKLKKKYPQLTYTIVGYGAGEERVKEEISKLEESAQKDIFLYGRCSPEELNEYYLKANLNLSVAGSCSSGAMLGVLSLPVRHYSYDCEVYGYLPGSIDKTVSDEPGLPVAPFIEEVINMGKNEYIAKCRDCYNCFKPHSKTGLYDINKEGAHLLDEEIDFLIWLEHREIFLSSWSHRINHVKEAGLFTVIMEHLKRKE